MSAELDHLRRRLYAPDVSAAEVERYRELAGEGRPDPAPAAAPAASRRRPVLVAAAAAVVVAVAGIGAFATARPHPAPIPVPAITPTPIPVQSSSDDSTVAVPAAVRTSFVSALQAGRSAGLLRYFYDHPEMIPAQLRTPRRADSYERFGSNTATVFLSPSPAAQKGGQVTVAVTLDRAARVQLRAVRADSGMQSFVERLDDGTRGIPGVPMVRTVVYDGEAPTVLELTVPKGVHWDVVAVFTD
ncbi:MAG TPA: hypothetical protein VGC94_07045 [Amnibacterium sp.]